jgi:hypothetical protein
LDDLDINDAAGKVKKYKERFIGAKYGRGTSKKKVKFTNGIFMGWLIPL